MKKRILASFLTVIIAFTSVHMEAYALADTYNANNYIVDKAEEYGGSHLVITNTSETASQSTDILPSVLGTQEIPALMNVEGEVETVGEDVYGYDSLGQQLVDPAMVLPKLGEDVSLDSSTHSSEMMQSVSTTAYQVGDTKTMSLMNESDGYYSYINDVLCVCVAIGEHCTVWIPADDPYYVACSANTSVNASVEPAVQENEEPEKVSEDSIVADYEDSVETEENTELDENTVSGNEVIPIMNESTVFGNEAGVEESELEDEESDSVSQNSVATDENIEEVEQIEVEESDNANEQEAASEGVEVIPNTAVVSGTNAMVKAMQELAAEFDDKYDDMVNMFGDSSAADNSKRGDADGKTAIVCYDIDGDFMYASAYVAGYFWAADLKGYGNSTGNEMDCIHIDSYQGMGRSTSDYSISLDYIDNCYSTLVHEYQHMIHYSHLEGKGLWADYTPTYINETFSAAAEYLMYGHNENRTQYYNYYSSFKNGLSLTQWDYNADVLMNYSVAYMFSQYIRTQYKGVKDNTGETIYREAMEELSSGKDLLDIIAHKIGTTSEDIWLNFRAALELKNETGPYGFGGETEFTKHITPKICTGASGSITLDPGGSIVIPIDEPYTPPAGAGASLKYLGIDLEQTEEDIYISFVEEEPAVIDSFAGTLELKTNVSPYYMSQDVTYSIVEGEENATLTDNVITALNDGTVKVRATWNEKPEVFKDYKISITGQHLCPISVTEQSSGNTLEFKSFADAVKGLDSVASKKAGTYIFTFGAGSVLSADMTLPSYVTEAVFKTAEYVSAAGQETATAEGLPLLLELDFAGNTLSSAGKITIEEGLVFVNSSEEKASSLKLTKSNTSGWNTNASLIFAASEATAFANLAGEIVSTQDRAVLLDNVNIIASNTAIELQRTAENVISYTMNSDISAQLLRITESTEESQGTWDVNGKLALGILDMQENGSATLLASELSASTGLKIGGTDTLYVDNASNVKDLYLLAGANLVTDSFKQVNGGKSYLAADSTWVINESATIYNPVLSTDETEEDKFAYLYKTTDATINLEGTLTRTAENVMLAFGKLSGVVDDVQDIELLDYAGQTKIFSTTNTKFPIDLVCAKQANEESATKYNVVYQTGNEVYVGANGIVVKSVGVSGEEVLESFAKWSDTAAYLDTLANTPMEYVVEISESLDTNEALTLPKKVNGITFRGTDPTGNRVTLTYTGDIRLNSNTTFENIDLVAKKYNSSTKSYDAYQSAVTLNGMTLAMKNALADFTSISGNNKSRLVMENAVINVTKAVSSLGYLDMTGEHILYDDGTASVNAILSADNVTVTDTLTMQSAKIDCVNKLALKNIITKDSYNVLSYGGNTSKDMLTITGNVTASDAAGMEDETVTIIRTEGMQNISKQALVRKNAICLQVKSMEAAGYSNAALLCNAEKAGAGWFVVGSKWTTVDDVTTREITYGTYKNAKAIYCGEIVANVKLYSADSKDGKYAFESNFATLQDALSEIDRLAVNTAFYRIELLNAEENVVTFNSKTPTFPAKTAGITIAASKELASPYIYFKGNLSLKCDTTFEDITFMPQTKSAVSLGNYELCLERCFVDPTRAGVGFTGITGSGVNGNSALTLNDTALAVAGTVNNVGTLKFTGETANEVSTFALVRSTPAYPTLIADGTVNVGNIELEKDGYLTGLSTVTRKNGQVTKIVPQITINKEVYSASNCTLYLDLQEKVSNQMVDIDLDTNEMSDIRMNGLSLAKALYVTYPNIKAAQRNEGTKLVKAGNYLTYFEDGFGVLLSYEDATSQRIEIPCRTFNDAVAEINNQKTKRDYTITLFDAITEFSGVDQSSGAIPTALTMPNKNYVETLTIQADEEAVNKSAIQLGFLNNITLTSNVVLKNINFVQMVKNGSVYQTSDFAKDDYPSALTFNTAGYNIEIEGENTFNTPLNLNGGNKSSLTFDTDGTITTFTNDYNGENKTSVEKNVIYGMLSGFDTVTVNDCDLILHDFKTSRTATSYTESKNKIITVNVFGTSTDSEGVAEYSGNIKVNSNSAKAEFAVTNYNSEDGSLYVEGKVNLKNVSLEGDAVATIHADTNFDITGTLISRSDKAMLETRLKSAGKEPYLNVSATVVRVGETGPVTVKVYPEITAVNPQIPVNMKSNAVSSKQLLAAKTAQARDFMPAGANYAGGEYDVDGLTDGYMMQKTGDKIYVYNGSQVALAVYKGEYTDGGNSELLGYYPTFAAATTDVNALKDKTQKYTYVLTKQNGTLAAPVAVSLPSQAESVTVTKLDGNSGNATIYLSGNISLQCDTTFENIEFAPVNRGAGTAFSISASGYDVALEDVTVNDESDKMALKDISGNGKQTIKLASPVLEMSGAITNAARVEVSEDITIKGNVKTTTLALMNNESGDEVTCEIGGTVTLDYLENKDDSDSVKNTLVYARNSSNVTNLTINKDIINDGDVVLLRQSEAYKLSVLSKKNGKADLSNAAKAFVLPKTSTDSFVLEADCTAVDGQADEFTVVKADKGVYIADSTLDNDIVLLKKPVQEADEDSGLVSVYYQETNCLDYSQAINEINTRADVTAAYAICFMVAGTESVGANEIDTNVKDTNRYGTLPLPKANTYSQVIVVGVKNGTTVVPFTGNISGQGSVTLQNLVLNPVKGGNDATPNDVKISITKDKKSSDLTLENVSTKVKVATDAKSLGFIASISGTRNETVIFLNNCEKLIVKSGISNVNDIWLDNTKLLSDGAVTVNFINLLNSASWDFLGKATVTDVYTDTSSNEKSTCYIGAKQDRNGIPQFILNGNVYDVEGTENDGLMLCKLYNADTTIADGSTIFAGNSVKEITDYANVSLVSAKKADADKIRAYEYKDDENVISYKDGVYVKNGDLSAMQIKLTEREQTADGVVLSTSYAATFEDAVTAINNKADTSIYYDVQFIQAGSASEPVVIKTTKKGTEYGAITLPTNAAGVTISVYLPEGNNTVPCTVIKYTGTLKSSCNVKFENILLTEGKVDKTAPDGFAENGTITPAPANNYTIAFGEKVYTYQNSVAESVAQNALIVDAINAGKGKLEFHGNNVVTDKTISIGTLTLLDGAKLQAVGKVTVTDLYADANTANSLTSDAAIAITNIKNWNEDVGTAHVTINSDFTKITQAGTFGNSQLTISGLIDDVNVKLSYDRYNLNNKTYEAMNADAFASLVMKSDAKPDTYKKLATVPKASLDYITVAGMDVQYGAYNHNDADAQTYLYKYETGLYLTDLKPIVLVNGYELATENEELYADEQLCYRAEFLSWDQAIKEIDKINEKKRYYKMILLDSIGYTTDAKGVDIVNAPIGTVSMPSKAAEVWVTSLEGEQNGIFFTGTNLALKCNTRMDNIGFTCVKKYGSGADTYYAPVTFTMNIGNFKLSQEDMTSTFVNMDTVPYTVSGSTKGIFELVSDVTEIREYAAIKGMNELVVDYTAAKEEGDGYSNFTLDCAGEVNVKNLSVTNSTVVAKNITVSTLATLDEAALQAGTSDKNDGKMTLKDMQLVDNGNALRAEQNNSGATQLVINGTVSVAENAQTDALADGTLEIALYYNNYKKGNNSQKPAQLYNGMILCTAQKVASDLFIPTYTQTSSEGVVTKIGMGKENGSYGLYKSGKNICYGKMADTREVQLEIGDSGMSTYFASFEEAVKEIDSLSLYKDPTAKTKIYEDYTITLLSDVEIGNANKNNSFSSLSLPSKAAELTINGNVCDANENKGYALSFANNVNIRCNTKMADISLYPIKNVKGEGVKSAVNYAIGNYTLELDNVISTDENGVSLFGKISGSSKSGMLKLAAGAEDQTYGIGISELSGLREVVLEEYTELHVDKNCNLYQITFGSGTSVLSVDGALTTTLINAENAVGSNGVYGTIRKPIASKMTVNGLYEDRDKDKEKEYYAMSFPEGVNDGQIQIEVIGSPCPAGTLVLTGKNLNWNDIQDNIKVVSKKKELSTTSSCITYTKGENLYIGEKEE